MANENEEKYGAILGTVKSEVEKGITDTVESVKGMGTLASNLGGYLKRDAGNAWDSLNESPAEKAKVKEKKAAEEKKKDNEKKAAAAAEAARIKKLQDSYITHTAVILCSYAVRESYLVVPTSHGELIHGIPQLNVGDRKPNVNVRSFGVCMSPKNPSVQAAAKKIVADIKDKPKTFTEKVMDFFSKPPKVEIGKDLVKMCAGVCKAQIFTDWIDGKKDVLIDGKPALLGRCKLQCGYGGKIKFYTSGQRED
ncbi:DUF4280 domain-containing protein [Clostridium estertheticum]|uniref:DUF4280 domain-containing protein n=1 Tax=Clostridium estertheticum TaxID=238834 RepID=UPI001C7DE9AB|nr:DUF4280 domain-containing protein [Clostridium estertheticum]MBX4262433.1 DUF4280 domain-containing protein [Clostridium estertheticum]MCB2359255.1 DUF4280 domain-containing protein [Clostridium estertheticum]WLC71984.1 DUF4280 domain-containing protein [Clostridium estertheticum]